MLQYVFLFVIGTVAGSFLNVCIHRLPRGESIVFPSSHCPQCGQRLSPLDLIPVLGYFLLRGKCRYCGGPIFFRYPLVEFVTGVFFVGAARMAAPGSFFVDFTFYVIFFCLLIVGFFVDLEHQLIPDLVSFGGILVGLLYYAFNAFISSSLTPLFSSLLGMFLGYFLLFLVSGMGKLWFKKEVMGEGDLYLAAMLGACLGWQGLLLSLFLAYVLAGGVMAVMLVLRKVKMGSYIPFGPALAGGGVIALFFGQQIISWYLSLLFL